MNQAHSALFKSLKVCVIIPTYNNAASLPAVITDVAAFTQQIIVVNDGSTDTTADVLLNFPFIDIVTYCNNKGKGYALQKGFARAVESGYTHAITIDSDGQHYADDLPVFLDALQQAPNAIIIGSRNMNQASVPGKSSFGNKFSSFWFRVETGYAMPDTQSGYRLYPVKALSSIRFFTRKYEFEIEVLVRAAWKGIAITNVPVKVYYAPPEERVSHFRPFKDFFRISVLNTILVLIAFLYIKPVQFLKAIFKKETWVRFWKEQVVNKEEADGVKAFSVGLGIFMGIVPIWGFQLATAIFLAFLLKLNKALVIVFANISLPPMIPLIIFASYKMGGLWMKDGGGSIDFSKSLQFESIKSDLQQYLIGATTLAFTAGIVACGVTWLLLKLFNKKTAAPLNR